MKTEELIQRVLDRDPDRVMLQVPEGLKTRVQEIEKELERKGIDVISSLERCYGACDLRDREAADMGCDLLVHLGHSRFFTDEEIDTLYFPVYYDVDPVPVIEENKQKFDKFGSIGLIASVNFIPALEEIKDYLEKMGKDVYMEDGERTEEGQVLGCDIISALKIKDNVDCFLYAGSGEFHPAGISMRTDKPVFVLDFERNSVETVETDKFKRQKHVAKEKARDCNKFGILVSTKPGQMNVKRALTIKDGLQERGKETWIFSMNEIEPEKFLGIDVDCLVNTACPRIGIEHRTDFKVPILNAEEIEDLLNSRKL